MTTSIILPDYVTADELADGLHYSPQQIRHLARIGAIPGVKRFRQWFFSKDQVAAALAKFTTDSVSKTSAKARRPAR